MKDDISNLVQTNAPVMVNYNACYTIPLKWGSSIDFGVEIVHIWIKCNQTFKYSTTLYFFYNHYHYYI